MPEPERIYASYYVFTYNGYGDWHRSDPLPNAQAVLDYLGSGATAGSPEYMVVKQVNLHVSIDDSESCYQCSLMSKGMYCMQHQEGA